MKAIFHFAFVLLFGFPEAAIGAAPLMTSATTAAGLPPAKYVTISVTNSVLLKATATAIYHLNAALEKKANPANSLDFGNGVRFDIFKHANGVSAPDVLLWSTIFARPNKGNVDLVVSLNANDTVYCHTTLLGAASSYDAIVVTINRAHTGLANLGLATYVNNAATVIAKPSPGATSNLGTGIAPVVALRNLIQQAQGNGSYDRVEIVLPQGIYRLADIPNNGEQPTDRNFLAISGNNITLSGAGTGATLIAETADRMFVDVRNASNVNLENLTFDIDQPALTFVQGTVTAVDSSGNITVALDWVPSSPDRFRSGDLLAHGFYPADANGKGLLPNQTIKDGVIFPSAIQPNIQANGPGPATLTFNSKNPEVVPNDRLALRYASRAEASLRFNNTTDCSVRNVTVLASGNLAMICRGTNGMHFNGYTIQTARTNIGQIPRLLSSIKDGIHYQGGLRGPTVESGNFSGMGDDAMNIYASPQSILASGATLQVNDTGSFAQGDALFLFQKNKPTNFLTNVAVTAVNPDAHTITLASSVDAAFDSMINLSRSSEGFLVEGTVFGTFRGIGMRVQTGFGLIHANKFTGTSGSPISFEHGLNPATFGFWEGPYPWNVSVTANEFTGSAYDPGYNLEAVRRIAPYLVAGKIPPPWFTHLDVLASPADGINGNSVGTTFNGRANVQLTLKTEMAK